MLTRIRDVRKARGLTLADVAAACDPPTTPQTIGRLETGMRQLSLTWMNRIAAALAGVKLYGGRERGKANREISEILGISPRTVNKHLEQIFEKMGIENRASAAAAAVKTLAQ